MAMIIHDHQRFQVLGGHFAQRVLRHLGKGIQTKGLGDIAISAEFQAEDSVQFAPARGAAIGRFWGTTSKMIIGAVVFVLLTVAAFLPG